MRTIEVTAVVTEDRKLTITLPSDIAPGEHQVVVVIDTAPMIPPSERTPKPPLKFVTWKWEAWPQECTFRREDIYGDDGR